MECRAKSLLLAWWIVVSSLCSVYALKCYDLVDSKCHLVECSGSCYYSSDTSFNHLIGVDAKCWNGRVKDGCIESLELVEHKQCFCNKDKCNGIYCNDHLTPSTRNGSESRFTTNSRTNPPNEETGSATETSSHSHRNSSLPSSSTSSRPSTDVTSNTESTTSRTIPYNEETISPRETSSHSHRNSSLPSSSTSSRPSTDVTSNTESTTSNTESTSSGAYPYDSSSRIPYSTTPKSGASALKLCLTSLLFALLSCWCIYFYEAQY